MSLRRVATRTVETIRIALVSTAMFQFTLGAPLASAAEGPPDSTTTPIKHVIVIIGETERSITFSQPTNQPGPASIRKANNQEVGVQAFIDPTRSGLSAVICSDATEDSSKVPLGADFEVAYNPLAQNEVPSGIIPTRCEWFSNLDGEMGELFREQTEPGSGT